MTEEEYYESLTDEVVGNDYVALKFNPRRIPPGFAKYADTSLGVQLWKNPNCGWAIVGDILCYFWVNSSNEYSLRKIIPLFYDESGKACHLGGEPIKVIKIPDYVNRHPVTDMGVYALERITELFPDLECVILPRTLKYLFSEFDLHPKYSRPLKIYVPRGTNYRYIWDDDIPLQSGLHHVMQPLNWGISRDVNAFPPTEPPADPWCTIM